MQGTVRREWLEIDTKVVFILVGRVCCIHDFFQVEAAICLVITAGGP